MTRVRVINRRVRNSPGGASFGQYLCRDSSQPTMWERIDLPQVNDLKQETVLRVLESVAGEGAETSECGCEELINRNPQLAHRAWYLARADFFRQKRGRSKQAPGVDPEPTGDKLPEYRDSDPLNVDLGYVKHRTVEAGALRLGENVVEQVIEVMAEAQQHRRSAGRLRGLPGSLRQKIGRLRRETGLPLDVNLL